MNKLTVLTIFSCLMVVPAMAQGHGSRQSDSPTRNNPNFTGGAQPSRGNGGPSLNQQSQGGYGNRGGGYEQRGPYGRDYGYGGRHYGPFEHMHRRERFERRFYDRY